MSGGEKILIIGACGQVGRELTAALILRYGKQAVLAADRLEQPKSGYTKSQYVRLDVTNKAQVLKVVSDQQTTQIYQLAAVLSASGEKEPALAWEANMEGLLTILDVAVKRKVAKVFWPSSIAVFGKGTPRFSTPQDAFSVPTTVYGISKLAGEYWCNYYFERYGLDVRSLRFPGLISYKALPGGGTTDYAVDIFYKAKAGEVFDCFLAPGTLLPMMFMDDAIRATLELMDADAKAITVRTSYNLAAMSFSPAKLAEQIQQHLPEFSIRYVPDFRQQIADSWPMSVNDQKAREDWAWQHRFGLEELVTEMLTHVKVSGPDGTL